jgi:hypothetical protein
MSSFILVPTEELPTIDIPFVDFPVRNPKYPRNWRRVSWLVRRWRGHRCERCQSAEHLTVHHCGTAFADGRPGDRRNKHDLRPENLAVLCRSCHDQIENNLVVRERQALNNHRALGVGTGLAVI